MDYILTHAEQEYKLRKKAIANNYVNVMDYMSFEDWFYTHYGDLLEEMGENTWH